MTTDELNSKLGELHMNLITEIQRRINAKEATSADLALAWKILTDNGVPLANLKGDVAGQEASTKQFFDSLPFPAKAKAG